MGYKVIWTEAALAELDGILEFISRDSPYYAAIAKDRILETARNLVPFPFQARIVPEFGQESIREVFVYSYRLIFKIVGEEISVQSIVHSARDFRGAKSSRENGH